MIPEEEFLPPASHPSVKISSLLLLYRYLFSVFKKFKWLISAKVLVTILYSIDLPLTPYLIGKMLDGARSLSVTGDQSQLINASIMYIAMIMLMAVSYTCADALTANMAPRIKSWISMTLTDRLISSPYDTHQKHFAGGLATKIGDVINGIPRILDTVCDHLISRVLVIIISICTLYQVDILFAIALTFWVSLFFVTLAFFTPNKLASVAAESRATIFAHIVDILSNVLGVKLFGGRSVEMRKMKSLTKHAQSADLKRNLRFFILTSTQYIAFISLQMVCVFLLIRGVKSGEYTIGKVSVVLSTNGIVIESMWYIAQEMSDFVQSIGGVIQGLATILEFEPVEESLEQRERRLIVTSGNIEYKSVSFHYPGKDPLFENLNIKIIGGQKIGLIGRSGSGKTTFVSLLVGLIKAQSGSIVIDGIDVYKTNSADVLDAIAYVPQDTLLFRRSIVENIRYGKSCASDDEVIEAAKKSGAHEFVVGLSNGYDTLIGFRGTELSGGQRQCIAIARAILRQSPILIIDEGTGQVDSEKEKAISENLWREFGNTKTVLIVAHKLSSVAKVDRILVFDDGKIVGDGVHETLIDSCELYKSLWTSQQHHNNSI